MPHSVALGFADNVRVMDKDEPICSERDGTFREEMIRRVNKACAGFPDKAEEDFLRLANTSFAKLAENDEPRGSGFPKGGGQAKE